MNGGICQIQEWNLVSGSCLPYFDELAKCFIGVKYLLVRQDMFGRTVDAKRMKTKGSTETFRAILTMITKKIEPKLFGLSREQKLLESLKQFAKLEEYKLYNEWDWDCICWTYTTIPENILYRYVEDYGYKYIHILFHFVITLNSSKKMLDRLDSKNCQDFRLSVHSVQQASTTI